ncbi:Crp/Fnr family transcriptional regulator [Stappia taiwanensis]|uniref:Crp/Fnr family transcriptional regulator n=1 Tax=Stappia taiwanensis TaxID=992267 RepID=A0A838XQH9_9HYPH|nr:Crp/Fnr family transcriptional regulator [Stappia taiwanensis]MBA4610846.1 Crp/Fnr family transcriptional regulator [Stappia taiwanensis]GGE95373.1 Crp/Fnr family transcriptional regulator [Stappia taiwanensis]
MNNATNAASLQALGGTGLDEGTANRLWQTGRVIELPEGQQVFAPGEACQGWLLVLSGSVRVSFTADTGREMLLYRVGSGETCVLTTACLLGEDLYSATGETEAPTRAFMLPAPAVSRFLDESPAFRRLVFNGFGQRLGEILKRMEDAVFHRIDARLARLLLEKSGDGKDIVATQAELAGELGTAREVVSRQIARWAREGIVERRRGTIAVLRPEELRRLGEISSGEL